MCHSLTLLCILEYLCVAFFVLHWDKHKDLQGETGSRNRTFAYLISTGCHPKLAVEAF